MAATNLIRRKVMLVAWMQYKISQYPWMFKRTFADCLKDAWRNVSRYCE